MEQLNTEQLNMGMWNVRLFKKRSDPFNWLKASHIAGVRFSLTFNSLPTNCYSFIISVSEEDLNFILDKLHPCAARWETIARCLGFKNYELEIIRANPQHLLTPPFSYLRAILAEWLIWKPGDARGSENYATLGSLSKAVRIAGFGLISMQLLKGIHSN